MRRFEWLRILLLPFSLLYWIAVTLKNQIYKSEILKKIFQIEIRKSQIPVVCVGNIRVGGTGKSQIVMTIAQRLIEQNQRVAILSRGYKRKSKGFFEVDSFDYEKFGDEPVLIKFNVKDAKVFVSEDRKIAIDRINQLIEFDFILMDDWLTEFKRFTKITQ